MRRLRGVDFDNYRKPAGNKAFLERNGLTIVDAMGDDYNGFFEIPSPYDEERRLLRILVGTGKGWEHISVSLSHRCPMWEEMEWIKRRFFNDDETVMQLHVPVKDHINHHPYVLHLWRPSYKTIPKPPNWMV